MLDRDTRHQLITFLTPLLEDERQRKAIVNLALGDTPVRSRIQWSGSPRLFTTEIVELLAEIDVEIAPGEPALLAVLEECRPYATNDQWPRIDALCQMVRPRPSQPVWRGSPYPGLMAFTEQQAPIFFGRSRELRELLRKVALPDHRFVCVIGASGSGKSSLVTAGLIPALRRDAIAGSKDWLVVRCVPGKGNDPLLALAFALDGVLESAGYRPEQVADQLAQESPPLDDIVRAALREQKDGAELLLFMDQLEELFTLVKGDAKVAAFVRLLDHAARHERIRLVATLRADFYAACLRHDTLTELLRHGSFPLSPPGPAALYQMITQPAALAGLTLEEGLPERLLEDIGADPGRLALLAFTLAELYQSCQDQRLTLVAYQDLSGVHGAIGRRADSIFECLGEAAQAALPVVFRELVEVDDAGVATRQRASLARITTPGAQELIDAFSSAQARLLVTDRDITDQPVVEVAHEALFSAWSLLAKWIDERRDDLMLLHHVKTAAEEWQHQGRDPTHLWLHERLAPVHDMLDRLDLKTHLEEPLKSFVRPEAERLQAELERPETSHHRRAQIGDRLDRIGDPRPGVGLRADGLPDIVWCRIPGGRVELERHAGTFDVAPFEIAKYPVTYRQYRAFLDRPDGYANPDWWHSRPQHEQQPGEQYRLFGNCPADNVSWDDAIAFCRWLSARLGYEVRLPTEWEWQQATTGGDPENVFPWGLEWESGSANTFEIKLGRTTAVGMYPAGASKQGVMDLAGNVWEWCLHKCDNPKDNDPSENDGRVLRGGSWDDDLRHARAAFRSVYGPYHRPDHDGFRVARCSPI